MPADADIVDLCEAIVTELNGEAWSLTFTAERGYLVFKELAPLEDLAVVVAPESKAIEIGSRRQNQNEYEIIISVIQSVDSVDGIDGLVKLVQEISGHILRQHLSGFDCIRVESRPFFDTTQLREHRRFWSVISTTWQGMSDLDAIIGS